MPLASFRIIDESGADVPYQRVSPTIGIDTEVTFVAEEVPSIGYRTYYLVPDEALTSPVVTSGVQVGANSFENAFYRLTLVPGGIRSLYDKVLGREVLRTEKVLGAEVVMLDSVGNGAGEFGSVQQPSTAADYERASGYEPVWEIAESGAVTPLIASPSSSSTRCLSST